MFESQRRIEIATQTEVLDNKTALTQLGYAVIDPPEEVRQQFEDSYTTNSNTVLQRDFDGYVLTTRRKFAVPPSLPYRFVEKGGDMLVELCFDSTCLFFAPTITKYGNGMYDPFPGFPVRNVLVKGKTRTLVLFSEESHLDRKVALSFFEGNSALEPADKRLGTVQVVQICMPRSSLPVPDKSHITWATGELLHHFLHENSHADLNHRSSDKKDETVVNARLLRICQQINNLYPSEHFFDIPLLRSQSKVQLSQAYGVKVNLRP
jgi:hypothetical protein